MTNQIQHNFTVRIANEYDVPSIMKITQQAFKQYVALANIPTTDALQETEADVLQDIKTKVVLLATINDIPVGSVRLAINKEDRTAYLSRFGVSMDYQNNGIGKVLMNVVDKVMAEHEIKFLYLHTASKVFDLIRFYYSRKFYVDSTTKDRGYIRAKLVKEYKYE